FPGPFSPRLARFPRARFPRPHAPSPRPAPWAILFRPAGWGSVLAYLLRTDSRVFLRNPQSRHFRSRALAWGVLTRKGVLSSWGGPLACERPCPGRAAARLMTPEGVIAGQKARPTWDVQTPVARGNDPHSLFPAPPPQ